MIPYRELNWGMLDVERFFKYSIDAHLVSTRYILSNLDIHCAILKRTILVIPGTSGSEPISLGGCWDIGEPDLLAAGLPEVGSTTRWWTSYAAAYLPYRQESHLGISRSPES